MNQKAYLVGTHRYSFRAGQPAEIIGVQFVTPMHAAPRPCYHIQFEDGQQDFVALSECHRFAIISEYDVRQGRLPEVVH